MYQISIPYNYQDNWSLMTEISRIIEKKFGHCNFTIINKKLVNNNIVINFNK